MQIQADLIRLSTAEVMAVTNKLLPWWASIKNERYIYTGLNSSKMTAQNWEGDPSELYNEIRMARQFKNINGIILFSAKSIAQNYSGLADSLKNSEQ